MRAPDISPAQEHETRHQDQPKANYGKEIHIVPSHAVTACRMPAIATYFIHAASSRIRKGAGRPPVEIVSTPALVNRLRRRRATAKYLSHADSGTRRRIAALSFTGIVCHWSRVIISPALSFLLS